MRRALLPYFIVVATLVGCGDEEGSTYFPYASDVISFEEGDGAGYGAAEFPDNVLGPPQGAGTGQGATEGVLSLGVGGTIIIELAEPVVDGPGPDLVVYENPFWVNGDASQVWAEFGEVSVSPDGQNWRTFNCQAEYDDQSTWTGCAGWNPVLPHAQTDEIDPEVTGGDPFDLADIGASEARFIRIRDLAKSGLGPSAGFDLDAVAGIYR